jgi:hypothetical protein
MSKPDLTQENLATRALGAGAIDSLANVPKERTHFRALLVGNPNYFGNLVASAFAPVLAVKGNPTYEQIKCLGFHPQAHRLDAVVLLNQPFGYGGGICTSGTQEYIRFYISLDNGATWLDQGLASFTANDVPAGVTGGAQLEYAVSVPCSPPGKFCTLPNTLLARAILSWQDIPPASMPGFVPVWGNVHTAHIQVDPTRLLSFVDVFKAGGLKISPELADVIDLQQGVNVAPKAALGLHELQTLYKGKGVEPHRYALAEVKQLIKTPEATAGAVHPLLAVQDKLGFKLADIAGKLMAPGDGSTVYEQLDCVGLRSFGLSDELVGVLRIKRSSGYSGGPCTAGSREYVTFWADFDNNGSFETCLGTASVQVFDVDVPPEGLEYSVHLPVDFNPYRRPCAEGPRVVPIRAILSWNDAPECSDPDWTPIWGNREDTLVLIAPGMPLSGYNPFLYDISGAAVCAIDQGSGLAAGGSPFGGTLCISGEIPGAMSLSGGGGLEYRLWATQGSTLLPIAAPFSVTVETGSGPATATSHSVPQAVNADGFFPYLEYGTPAGGGWQRVSSPNRLLAYWNTAGLTGTWTIHIEARSVAPMPPAIYAAGTTTCLADGTLRQSINVTLDQEAPDAHIRLTGYTDAGGFHPAVPCGDIQKGVTVNGEFDITDNRAVGSYSLAVEPSGTVTVEPDPASTPTHVFGRWSIATASLPPCGYVVHLRAHDRTIANCSTAWGDDDTVGFCLRKSA